jgi:hypothetical protein
MWIFLLLISVAFGASAAFGVRQDLALLTGILLALWAQSIQSYAHEVQLERMLADITIRIELLRKEKHAE